MPPRLAARRGRWRDEEGNPLGPAPRHRDLLFARLLQLPAFTSEVRGHIGGPRMTDCGPAGFPGAGVFTARAPVAGSCSPRGCCLGAGPAEIRPGSPRLRAYPQSRFRPRSTTQQHSKSPVDSAHQGDQGRGLANLLRRTRPASFRRATAQAGGAATRGLVASFLALLGRYR